METTISIGGVLAWLALGGAGVISFFLVRLINKIDSLIHELTELKIELVTIKGEVTKIEKNEKDIVDLRREMAS